jgi:hypothetical protein
MATRAIYGSTSGPVPAVPQVRETAGEGLTGAGNDKAMTKLADRETSSIRNLVPKSLVMWA